MLIKVTKKDIEEGYPNECRSCPVALAAIRAKFEDAIVTNEYIIELHKEYLLPKKVQDFIDNFDAGRKVEPFEFEIEKD